MAESFFDGLVGHGRYPETFNGLFASGFFQNQAGNQLPLPSRVCGDNDFPHVWAVYLGFDSLILFTGLLDDFQLEVIRHHGKVFHLPFLIFSVIVLRVCQGDQMPQPPGDNIIISLNITRCFLRTVKDPCNVAGHGRFFCND